MLGVGSVLFLGLELVALVLKVWALADALYRPAPFFVAAGKLTKGAWVAILAVALLVTWFGFLTIFGIASIIAAIVYLVDVRPAVQALKPGNNPYA